MSIRNLVPVLPFRGAADRSPRIEVQRFDRSHFNVGAGPHAHRFHELVVIDAGRGRQRLDRTDVRLSAGDVVMVAPGGVHDCEETSRLEGWLVLFCDDAVSSRAEAEAGLQDPRWTAFRRGTGPTTRLHLGEPDRSAVVRYVEELDTAQRCGGSDGRLRAAAWLDLLLLELHGHAQQHRDSRDDHDPQDPLAAAVLAFIDHEYQRPLALAEVARHFALSPSHLTRRVRDATGTTVQQWIIARRLAGARSLLRDTDASVEVIAREVGYVDTAHFGRHFRREHGCSPGAWRRSIRR